MAHFVSYTVSFNNYDQLNITVLAYYKIKNRATFNKKNFIIYKSGNTKKLFVRLKDKRDAGGSEMKIRVYLFNYITLLFLLWHHEFTS